MAASSLFGKNQRNGCRAVVTGQVGVDKKPFHRKVVSLAEQRGHHVTLCNVGDMMYAEAPDVVPGRILCGRLPTPPLRTKR